MGDSFQGSLSCAPRASLPVHLFQDFVFPLTFPVFMISVGKRLVTSTNLEYSFFCCCFVFPLFCP